MVLVDTSVLINFLKGISSPEVSYFRELQLQREPFGIALLSAQEILQGAKDEKEWRLLSSYLSTQLLFDVKNEWKSYRQAAKIYFDGRRRGLTIRSTVDCLVAQIALDNRFKLLHADKDFISIQKIRPLRLVIF